VKNNKTPRTDAAEHEDSQWCANLADFARTLERELSEVRTALTHALNYCESTDGRRGPLMGSAVPAQTWRKLHALAANAQAEGRLTRKESHE
jgi:hypothetical protein